MQRDLPEFTLRHASETYTAPVKGWPGIYWSRRHSGDALATTVSIDIDTATDDTITTKLWIGHQAPNLTKCTTPSAAPAPSGSSRNARKGQRSGFEPHPLCLSVRSVVDPNAVRSISPLEFTTGATEEHRGRNIPQPRCRPT